MNSWRHRVAKYFGSGEEILARIAADAFADWGARVRDAVGRRAIGISAAAKR